MTFNIQEYILIASIILAIIGIVAVQIIKRRAKSREKEKEEKMQEQTHHVKFRKIFSSNSSEKEKLSMINSELKSFLNEKFSINPSLSYLEIAETSKNKNLAELCRKLNSLNYLKKEINKEDIKELSLLLAPILRESLENAGKEKNKESAEEKPDKEKTQKIEAKREWKKEQHIKEETRKLSQEILECRREIIRIAREAEKPMPKLQAEKVSKQLHQAKSRFSQAFHKVIQLLPEINKKEARKITEKFNREKSKIHFLNPIQKFQKEMKLFESYLTSLSIAITKFHSK